MSASHSTPISTGAIVHTYDMAQFCWIALTTGACRISRVNYRFNAGRCSRDHCCCDCHCSLTQCDVLFPHFLHPSVCHFSSLQPLYPPPSASARRPSAILFLAVPAHSALVVRAAGSPLLSSHAFRMTSVFFAHLLLNAMWFPV